MDLSVNGEQIIAPIEMDFNAKYNNNFIDVNLVSTYFNKKNIGDLIKEAVALETNNKKGFFYVDKKRTQSIFEKSGYQLPSRLINLSSDIIIRKIDDNVNKKINKITQSQQFIRWFGDWQNHPESASKVVDNNGEPLVVYHGTLTQGIHEFKKEFIGSRYSFDEVGFFFTDRKSIAEDYASSEFDSTKKGDVIPVYLNMRNPLYFDKSYAIKNGYGNVFRENDSIGVWDAYQGAILDEVSEKSRCDGVIIDDGTSKMLVVFEPTQIKSATDNIGTFDGNNPDIRYQSRNTEPDYNFSKALSNREWSSFYSSIEKSNQRNSFRIGDHGILITDEKNPNNYKLVCYDGDSVNMSVNAVYKLENYDYNIHDGSLNIAQTIIDRKRAGLNEEYTKTILQSYSALSGTVFREYNGKTGKFVKLTRSSNKTLQYSTIESNGTGISENAEQGISDSGVKLDFPQFQMRPDNGFANRRLLANALEKSAQNNYEKNKGKRNGVDQRGRT